MGTLTRFPTHPDPNPGREKEEWCSNGTGCSLRADFRSLLPIFGSPEQLNSATTTKTPTSTSFSSAPKVITGWNGGNRILSFSIGYAAFLHRVVYHFACVVASSTITLRFNGELSTTIFSDSSS